MASYKWLVMLNLFAIVGLAIPMSTPVLQFASESSQLLQSVCNAPGMPCDHVHLSVRLILDTLRQQSQVDSTFTSCDTEDDTCSTSAVILNRTISSIDSIHQRTLQHNSQIGALESSSPTNEPHDIPSHLQERRVWYGWCGVIGGACTKRSVDPSLSTFDLPTRNPVIISPTSACSKTDGECSAIIIAHRRFQSVQKDYTKLHQRKINPLLAECHADGQPCDLASRALAELEAVLEHARNDLRSSGIST